MDNNEPLNEEVFIDCKRNRAMKFKWVILFIISPAIILYFGFVESQFLLIALGLGWLYYTFRTYGGWKTNGNITISKSRVSIISSTGINYEFKWSKIDFFQFEETFGSYGKTGTILHLYVRNDDIVINFTNYNIKEQEFKILVEKYSGKKLFKENYKTIS